MLLHKVTNDFLSYLQERLGIGEVILWNNPGKVGMVCVPKLLKHSDHPQSRYLRTATHTNIILEENLVKEALSRNVGLWVPRGRVKFAVDFTSLNPTGTPHVGNVLHVLQGGVFFRLLDLTCDAYSIYYLNNSGLQLNKAVDALLGSGSDYPELRGFKGLIEPNRGSLVRFFTRWIFVVLERLGIPIHSLVPETFVAQNSYKVVGAYSRLGMVFRDKPDVFTLKLGTDLLCLVRRGWYTYTCNDLSLQRYLHDSGFDRSIMVLSSDHEYHTRTITVACNRYMLGRPFLRVILTHRTRLFDDRNEEVKLSKRGGVNRQKVADTLGDMWYWVGLSQGTIAKHRVDSEVLLRLRKDRLTWCLANLRLRRVLLYRRGLSRSLCTVLLRFQETLHQCLYSKSITYLYNYVMTLSRTLNYELKSGISAIEYLQSLRVMGLLNRLFGLSKGGYDPRAWAKLDLIEDV